MTCSDKTYGGVVKCTPMPTEKKTYNTPSDENAQLFYVDKDNKPFDYNGNPVTNTFGFPINQITTPEQAKEFMHVLSKDGKCTDETCGSCGKKKSGIQWRLSSIAKKQPLPGKGFTYLHIRVNTKQGHITGFKTVPTKQTTEFYQQVAGLMYNETIEKYG